MNTLYYNNYLSSLDLLYRNKLKSLYKIPKIQKINLNFSIKFFLEYLNTFLETELREEVVNSNIFLTLYILFFSCSFIKYKRIKEDFNLKYIFVQNTKCITLLFNLHYAFYIQILSKIFISSNLTKKINTLTKKISLTNVITLDSDFKTKILNFDSTNNLKFILNCKIITDL